MSAAPHVDTFNIVHPQDYAEKGYPHDSWTWMRANDPVFRWEAGEGIPFWCITKHEDVTLIGRDPARFVSGPRLTISHEPEVDIGNMFPPTLIQMDNPNHSTYRKLINKRFTPGAMRRYDHDIETIAAEIVEKLLAQGEEGECDFVESVSAPLPIAVIAWMLGLPKPDWPLLFDWTNRIIGAADPDYQDEGSNASETAQTAITELFGYFTQLVEEKRKNPSEDLVSLFTQMEIEGKKLEFMDIMAWCLIIVVAGNETTRNATTGGMLAFIQNQDQLRSLQADETLMKPAIEEVVRWTSPIIHFARTATEDYELRGKQIKEGDAVALFYGSANRDEDVFDEPFQFRINRWPNRHLGFGIGEHFCLGAHVARLEMEAAYRHFLPRLAEVELAGPVDRLHSSLVGGVKRLPIRYRLA